jgi:hypothetical protein
MGQRTRGDRLTVCRRRSRTTTSASRLPPIKPLEPLAQAEALRHGEGGKPCSACNRGGEPDAVDGEVWRDDHWRISVTEPSGAPLILILSPQAHDDFTTLPMDRAAEMGQLRGTMMAVWDDYLPPVPVDVRDANARAVVQDLVRSYGGRALGPAA